MVNGMAGEALSLLTWVTAHLAVIAGSGWLIFLAVADLVDPDLVSACYAYGEL